METARLMISRKARALSAGVAFVLVVGTSVVAPWGVLAQDQDQATQFDVSVASVDELGGLSAVVANSGDGVNLRAEASQDAEIVTTLPEGTVVALRIDETDTVYDADGVTRWWPVRVDGQDGWISGFYLGTAGDAAPAADEPEPATEDASVEATTEVVAEDLPADSFEISVEGVDGLSGLTAQVSSPDGVNLRAEPNASAEVVTTVSGGAVVALRIDLVDTVTDDDGNRWWPVSADGQDGWIVGAYLAEAGEAAPAADDTDAAASDQASTATAATDDLPEDTFDISVSDVSELSGLTARVNSPDGVNLRAEPAGSADIVGTASIDTIVELRVAEVDTVIDDAGSRWWPVRHDGVDGWIVGAYLADSGGASAASDAAAPQPEEQVEREAAKFAAGDYAAAETNSNTGVNIRAGASTGSERVGSVAETATVQVVSGPYFDESGNGWYEVDNGEVTGFADGDLLVAAEESVAAAPAPQTGPTGGFIYPVSGAAFTQAYGCTGFTIQPFDANLGCHFHNGIDLAAPAYTPLVASYGGTVVAATWCDCGLGYYATVDHGNGFRTTYGHMAEMPYVAVGQAVNQGDVLGPMGSTGLSTGSHVHFIVELNGSSVDPLAYLS